MRWLVPGVVALVLAAVMLVQTGRRVRRLPAGWLRDRRGAPLGVVSIGLSLAAALALLGVGLWACWRGLG